jgi:hypothetical protein
MEGLPWELIGQIGDFLLPKWRCRLYICCREWYAKCYLAAKDVFTVYRHKLKVNADINNIQYNIASDKNNGSISEIIKHSGDTPTYAFHTTLEYDEPGKMDSNTIICNDFEVFIYNVDIEMIVTYINRGTWDNHIKRDYKNTRRVFNLYYLMNHDEYKYKVYKCFRLFRKYITHRDVMKFIEAFGKEFMNAFKYDQ